MPVRFNWNVIFFGFRGTKLNSQTYVLVRWKQFISEFGVNLKWRNVIQNGKMSSEIKCRYKAARSFEKKEIFEQKKSRMKRQLPRLGMTCINNRPRSVRSATTWHMLTLVRKQRTDSHTRLHLKRINQFPCSDNFLWN